MLSQVAPLPHCAKRKGLQLGQPGETSAQIAALRLPGTGIHRFQFPEVVGLAALADYSRPSVAVTLGIVGH